MGALSGAETFVLLAIPVTGVWLVGIAILAAIVTLVRIMPGGKVGRRRSSC
jgi:hypothetical protein